MSDAAGPSNEPSTRSVYLMTYSKADIVKVPDKATFIDIISDAYSKCGTAKIVQYACAMENHADGTPHYHMVVKLDKQKRWRGVRSYLSTHYGLQVNWSNQFTNYYDGYQYVVKSDQDVAHSDNHPQLTNPFRTVNATQARRQGHNRSNRKRSFDAVDMADTIEKNNIHDKTALLDLVKKQKAEGKRDLALYVLNNTDKCVKLITTVWDMNNAHNVLHRRSSERMQLLHDALVGECTVDCGKRWLAMAKQNLANNDIDLRKFSGALSQAIEKGRGKNNNILLTGGGNCGKSFLLKPLRKIFNTFSNPATGSFAWLGIENAEIIFLNDFRWDATIIAWKDFLLLLEGDELHFPAPKTSYPQDILFNNDTPIFATADECFKKSRTADRDNYMMTLRWNRFDLTYEIPKKDIVNIEPCGRCFAELIIHN